MTTKPDLERLGIFKEAEYHTINDPYSGGKPFEFNKNVLKGRQMYPGITHSKTALTPGYFGEFKRVLDGEAYSDMVKRLRKEKNDKKKFNYSSRNFYPSSNSKKPSGLGSVYGLFHSSIPYFSPIESKPQYKHQLKNAMSNPGKKGSGYGYVDVTIGKHPSHLGGTYDFQLKYLKAVRQDHEMRSLGRKAFALGGNVEFFGPDPFKGETFVRTRAVDKGMDRKLIPFRPSNPGKNPGGSKAGCFESFPANMKEPFKDKYKMNMQKPHKGIVFNSAVSEKSVRQESILNKNVNRIMNCNNFKQVNSSVYCAS